MHKTTSCLLFALAAIAIQSAQAQKFVVLHQFTGGKDGAQPQAGLTMDSTGIFYGTTSNASGSAKGFGTVFRLSHSGSTWTFKTLHSFKGGFDGSYPLGRTIIGSNGTLYGTTSQGGNGFCNGSGCGTVFNIKLGGAETVLYRFTGGIDGANPENGDLVFDGAGNIYGTTGFGGSASLGVVYKLTFAYGSWAETVLHSFGGGIGDGANPYGGVIFDNIGDLYGTTTYGGSENEGTAFQLTPSGKYWSENIIHNFSSGDGYNPAAGLIFDQSGNLYGTASDGYGSTSGGTIFELSNNNWILTVLYALAGSSNQGAYPEAALVMDAAGNLYGTTAEGGAYGNGVVFKLSSGSWTYTSLHDFTGGKDGAAPKANLIFDANGKLYGTTAEGGKYGKGVVFEITP
jgi:uncharacterized repeat protein (TIGR03803 family)